METNVYGTMKGTGYVLWEYKRMVFAAEQRAVKNSMAIFYCRKFAFDFKGYSWGSLDAF